MFDWFSSDSKDAISILKADHDRVKKLFDNFEDAKSRSAKKKIVTEALTELKVHAAVEEDLFYPAVRKKLAKPMMNEADEEHHVAKVLIAELDSMTGSEDHYDAKFTVLSENVRHHIKEEENEMLPQAKGLNIDFDDLGDRILRHKRQLLTQGFPTVGEETMVAASRGKGDSPAKAAKKTIKVKPKSKK
ncbi:MAG: hemerythrin domain-containing protein [Acidobacteriota bacterium]|nr:hemerythrin domain-containing protein [Acidobacteriota bacterium]